MSDRPGAARDEPTALGTSPPLAPDAARAGEFRWPAERPAPPRPAPRPAAYTRWRGHARRAFVLAGAAVATGVYLAPLPAGLAPEGKTAAAVFTLCVALWISNAIPIGITGLLAVALLGLSGAMTPADAFAAFGNSAVFFILGVFIIAAALIRTGLSKRCALLFLSRFGSTPHRLATGMMIAAACATMWMPAQATTAMLFPIAFELARAMRLRAGASPYGKMLFLSLAWGAMIGSNATFLGSTRAPLALGMLWSTHHITIGFADWLLAAFPIVLLGAIATPLVLRAAFPAERVDAAAARAALEAAVAELGPIQAPQVRAATIMGLTIVAWVALGGHVDLAIIALLAAAAMFATRLLRWEDLEGRIHWGVVLMYGGAIALGVAIDRSGAAEWLVGQVAGDFRIPAAVGLIILAIATLLLSEVMSNAAAVAVMLPLGFSLAGQIGASPVALVLATSIGAGLAFTLPISSAPNAIAYASGYLGMTDFIRVGTVVTVTSMVILLLVALLWWPLIGIL